MKPFNFEPKKTYTVGDFPRVVEAIAWHDTKEGKAHDAEVLAQKRLFVKQMLFFTALLVLTVGVVLL
jgi:hypothetical protein